MKTITVKTSKPYEILIGENIINQINVNLKSIIKSKTIVVITDDIVKKLYYNQLKIQLSEFNLLVFTIKNGENSKRIETVFEIYNFLFENNITRSDLIIAFGGGVVGDIAGFVASTYQRGVDYIQIPTTFLSQIDSSVGGKTGINLPTGKNIIGTFYQPKLVICDTAFLKTLKEINFLDGISEAIKCGLIKDKYLIDLIDDYQNNIEDIICRCIGIKKDIVELDEFDKSQRMLLNFGHTIGHAIESYFNYEKYSHGQAVAIGMYQIVKKHNIELGEATKEILIKNNLPYECKISNEELFNLCCKDKKRTQNSINIVLLESVGNGYIEKLTLQNFSKFLKG